METSLTSSHSALLLPVLINKCSLWHPRLSCFIPAVTQRCPGQVGGGWEETDSGNSSSHNSSQDMAANSRASVGSKSAGTGSQSGASRESSGDLSERWVVNSTSYYHLRLQYSDISKYIIVCAVYRLKHRFSIFPCLLSFCSHTLSGLQGGGLAFGGLWPGDGTHQQTDWRFQSFLVQGGEPALHQRVSASKIRLRIQEAFSPFIKCSVCLLCFLFNTHFYDCYLRLNLFYLICQVLHS